MSTKGLMISYMIYMVEGQDIATSDIPWAFLQNDYDKGYIHIKMEGVMVTLLKEIKPTYYTYLIYI